jgi:peptidoglycan/LPS O-acetylase OafA/YrhL
MQKFRPDIQGIRALAVLGVVANHAGVPFVPGGYAGVDVFFVLSGFLITRLLAAQIDERHRVSLPRFYTRRAARILPAATVTLCVTIVLSHLWLPLTQAQAAIRDALWAAFFGANIHFASTQLDYFHPASIVASPVQHFWSLSVEEQFYLLWPVILGLTGYAAVRRGWQWRPFTASVGLALTALSFLHAQHYTSSSNPGSYFFSLSRFWELGIGAVLALLMPLVQKERAARSLTFGSWLGFVLIVGAFIWSGPASGYPGPAALVPVMGTVVLLVAGNNSHTQGAGRLLSAKPLQFVGDISYSLYLWHFPLLILIRQHWTALNSPWGTTLLIFLAVAIASVSYYFVEQPFRRGVAHAPRLRRGLSLWPLAFALTVSTAVVAWPHNPFSEGHAAQPMVDVPHAVAQSVHLALQNARVPLQTSPSVVSAVDAVTMLHSCGGYLKVKSLICQKGSADGSRTIVLFGDSHSSMWEPAIAGMAKNENYKFFPFLKEACGYDWYVNTRQQLPSNHQCILWYQWAVAHIATIHPDVIVVGTYDLTAYWQEGLRTVLAQMHTLAPRVILVSDTPRTSDPSTCLMTPHATLKSCLFPVSATNQLQLAQARSIARDTSTQFLDITPWFCTRRYCPSVIHGFIPYRDGAHLTKQYSVFLTAAMGRALDIRNGQIRQPAFETHVNHS